MTYFALIREDGTINVMLNGTYSNISDAYTRITDDEGQKVDAAFKSGLGVRFNKEKNAIETYTLPPPPLKDVAQNALSSVQSQAPMIVAMGESFGPKTKSYVQSLQAIINGTDTTSTELPARPDDLTS